MDNPYKYSLDNKRYQTWNYYSLKHFGTKIAKVPLNAGFTCPNRDGKYSTKGCYFCPGNGIDDFPGRSDSDLLAQFNKRKQLYLKKWPAAKPQPYFQSYSNTYGSLEKLKTTFEPFIADPTIKALFIATRVDCLSEEIIELLSDYNKQKEIWIELGIQSIHDKITMRMNCYHTFDQAKTVIAKLAKEKLHITVHLINGLPGETKEMMLENAEALNSLPIDAVKFHNLLILKDSYLAGEYQKTPFPLLSQEEYFQITGSQLEILDPNFVIERVMSDAPLKELIAPLWTREKITSINYLDRLLKQNNTWQGKYYRT